MRVDSNSDRASSETSAPSVRAVASDVFWKKYPVLVWSNRQADDDVRIRAALMKPQFPVLLDIAATFGPVRLEREWSVLRADAETNTQSIEAAVSRMLANIWRGYEQASA